MWVLIGMTTVFLSTCSYMDFKSRQIDIRLIVVAGAGAVICRVFMGIGWYGFMELGLRFVPGAIFLLISVCYKEQVGVGDGLMLLICGYTLGAEMGIMVSILSCMLAGLFGLMRLLMHKSRSLPFAPFLLAGCICTAGLRMIYGKG